MLVTIEAYAPAGAAERAIYAFPLTDVVDVLEAAEAAASDLVYDVDLAECALRRVRLLLQDRDTSDQDAPLEGVERCLVRVSHVTRVDLGFVRYEMNHGVQGAFPAHRTDDELTADLVVREDDPQAMPWLEWESESAARRGQVLCRTPLLADGLDASAWGLLTEVDESITPATINDGLPTRVFRSGAIVHDMDVDFVAGRVRVIGRVGVGTGANAMLLSICRFEGHLALAWTDHDGTPYEDDQIDDLVTVTVDRLAVDALPGTDLDELPWWALVLLSIPTGGAVGAGAAVVAVVEAILRPVVRDTIQAQVRQIIADRVRDEIEAEVDRQLASAPVPVPRDTVLEAVWFQPDGLSVATERIRLTGFAGLWHPLVAALSSPGCAFASSAAGSPQPLPAMVAFRRFERVLDGPRLRGWRDRLASRRVELAKLVDADPALGAELVAFAMTHADGLDLQSRVGDDALTALKRIAGRARAGASAELVTLIDDALDVLERGRGHRLAVVADMAARRTPPRRRRARDTLER